MKNYQLIGLSFLSGIFSLTIHAQNSSQPQDSSSSQKVDQRVNDARENLKETKNEAQQQVKEAKENTDKTQEKANKNIDEANDNVKRAETSADEVYAREWKNFKSDFDTKFNSFQYNIKDLRSRKLHDPVQQQKFNKEVDQLESQNLKQKIDLTNFKYDGRTKWLKFEDKFNKRQNKLSESLFVLKHKYSF